MNAIILAAGKGTRLRGSTVTPKCLIDIGGETLLQRQIASIRRLDIDRIVIVVGFAADCIRQRCDRGIVFVENPIFDSTSSLYSLWLARDYMPDGFVVLNSDVLFHPRLLADLINSPAEDALLISDGGAALGAEEMKVRVENGRVVDISKDIDPSIADGENVGIVKFGPAGARALVREMTTLVSAGAGTDWAPRAFREFARHRALHVVSTGALPWIEIDFPEDYERAVTEIYPRIQALLQTDGDPQRFPPAPMTVPVDN